MQSPRYNFGEFELDIGAFELQRLGERVPLERIPMELLILLVRRRRELVTREEIADELWGSEIFIDTNTAINVAVRKIRQALDDTVESPRYILTIPAKGYRFIGSICDSPPKSPNGTQPGRIAVEEPPEMPVSQDPEKHGPAGRQDITGPKNLLKPGITVAAIAVLLSICIALWDRQPQPPTVTNTVRLTNDGKAKSPMNLPVTDGANLYFIEGMPWTSGSGIAQMSATGGETTWIATTLPEALAIYSISPDRSKLLVVNGAAANSDLAGELWMQPLPAGAPHRAGNIIASAACWTPDGTHIVYAYHHAIMIANQDGSEPHQLATVSGVVRAPRFSPDGRLIRFYILSDDQDSSSIWEMDANGKDIHPLFPDWKESRYQCCGNWSPDGDYYYFVAGRGSVQAIWVTQERRSIFRRAAMGPWRLISGPLRFSAPLPSSDGKRLFVMGDETRVELFRYDPRARRFDPYLPGLSAGPVDFSPDRQSMAYVSYPEGTLWRSRIDGTGKVQLTFPPVRAYEPRWSPDGSKIAFMDVQYYRPWRIALLSSSGGSPEPLERAPNGETEGDPTWAPDGRSIVFGKSHGDSIAIYRLDLETSKVSPIPDSDGLFSPRLSPDGRYISALTNGATKLMLFDASTNHWSDLAEGEAVSFNEWSHDGKYVYMRENRGGGAELVRVRIKDRVLEDVLSFKDFPASADDFAGWVGLTPDDAPLLMRDRSLQEIYALDLHFQ